MFKKRLYKLYGYCLCKGKPTPKIAYKVQHLYFKYMKFLVILGVQKILSAMV